MTIFVDTNVLLYSIEPDPAFSRHRDIATDILNGSNCTLSVQVLNEFVWQSTRRKWSGRISFDDAMDLVNVWRRHTVLPLDLPLFDAARDVADRTNYTWWDCLIIAAAIIAGCDALATEDMQHGHVIDGVRIANPFRDAG